MTNRELFSIVDEYKQKINANSNLMNNQIAALYASHKTSFIEASNSLEESYMTTGTLQKGHEMAYDYILTIAAENSVISEELIKELYTILYQEANDNIAKYRQTPAHLFNTKYNLPEASEVPRLMEHFIKQMEYSKNLMHPIEYAVMCHKRLLDIHPFIEGNGIIARLILNLILINNGYGIAIIPASLGQEYEKAIIAAHNTNYPDIDSLIQLVSNCVIDMQKDTCSRLGI